MRVVRPFNRNRWSPIVIIRSGSCFLRKIIYGSVINDTRGSGPEEFVGGQASSLFFFWNSPTKAANRIGFCRSGLEKSGVWW